MNHVPGFLSPAPRIARRERPIRVFGIDLGTTNSSIAEITFDPSRGGGLAVRCLDIPQGMDGDTGPLVPSIVLCDGGAAVVGGTARRLAARMGEFGCIAERDVFAETKNDMGLLRGYPEAPPGFRTPPQIASHILRFLHESALAEDSTSADAVAISVPASFQTAQRKDTLAAAALAGLEVVEGTLLDEPTAAFLDWIAAHGTRELDIAPGRPANVLVFDFGGGTCDVAILRVTVTPDGGRLQTSALAVSRYHRLGGGDIDAAIVEEVLVPLLEKQNALAPFALDYDDKARSILPAFRQLAESLKIKLCEWGRSGFYPKAVAPDHSPAVRLRGSWPVSLRDGRELTLSDPALSLAAFEKLLEPFLDRDFLFARETDYRMTCSIFAPLTEVLDRVNLDPHLVHSVLLTGGSSLIPQVRDAVAGFFAGSHLLSTDDAITSQTAVARGAAWHALSLALFGRGVVEPVCRDRIAIQTTSGPVELIPQDSGLPFPSSDGWAENHALVIPETSLEDPLELRIELVGSEDRAFGSEIWRVDDILPRSTPLRLSYRMDANQDLHVRLAIEDGPLREMTFENPLTHVVNPSSKRARILKLEKEIARPELPEAKLVENTKAIASLYSDLGQREKALDVLRRVLRDRGGADAGLLLQIGITSGELGDHAREEKFFLQSARVSRWSAPLFNLALSRRRRGLYREAMTSIDEAIARNPEPPAWVLKADIAKALGEPHAEPLKTGMGLFAPATFLDDWQLGWYLFGATLSNDPALAERARTEQRRRLQTTSPPSPRGVLPEMAPAIQRMSAMN